MTTDEILLIRSFVINEIQRRYKEEFELAPGETWAWEMCDEIHAIFDLFFEERSYYATPEEGNA